MILINLELRRRSLLQRIGFAFLSATGLLASASSSHAGSGSSGSESLRTPDEVLSSATDRLGISGSGGIIGTALADGSDGGAALVSLERQVFILIKELAGTQVYDTENLIQIKLTMGPMRTALTQTTKDLDVGTISHAAARNAARARFGKLVDELSHVPRRN